MQHEQSLEEKRASMTAGLVNPDASPRYVVGAEDTRVTELLDETYHDPYENSGKIARLGRGLIARTGLYTPRGPELVERPLLESTQERHTDAIRRELEFARDTLGRHAEGVDDVAIDAYLQINSDDSIIPPHFRHLYREAQKTSGEQFTFIKWMTHHASDEQLLNVLQWHDSYLQQLDESPEFIERVERLKHDYIAGLETAKEAGHIHDSFLGDTDTIRNASIQHASPLSVLNATSRAFLLKTNNSIQVRPDVDDLTIFHELTHNEVGFTFEFDEGFVDRAARIIYRQGTDHYAPEDESVYLPQMKTLDAIGRLAPDAISTYNLSKLAAGKNRISNTVQLLGEVDHPLGFPLFLSLTASVSRMESDYYDKFPSGQLHDALQMILNQRVELAVSLLLSRGDAEMPHSIQDFVTRIVEIQSTLDQDQVLGLLTIAKEVHDVAEKLDENP